MVGQRIRDPLHNLIEFHPERSDFENALWNVVQTRPFQRLRRVKQLGFSDLVYPGATHSRYAHSLGVLHTARRLIEVIDRDASRKEEARSRNALAAALVHDVGHGPFSHAFEAVGKKLNLKMADHEIVSDALIRDSEIAEALQALGSGFANDVADVISGRGQNNIHRAVVSSQFDADRLDYMRRDRLMTGTQQAAIDFEWLVANLEVGSVPNGVDEELLGEVQTFVLGPKAIYAAEAFVLGLFQLYPTVYFHKATRGAEKLFTELLVRVIELANNASAAKTGLPDTHALIKFATKPDQLDLVMALDDTVVWGALSLMVDAPDACVSQFATRLRDRNLYKCIDVRVRIAHHKGDNIAHASESDRLCAAIKEKITEWASANSSEIPRVLIDEESRSPYKKFTETKGPLGQINIRTDGGRLVDLASRSKVVAALETFKFLRIYHAKQDADAKSAIHAIIDSEICQ